MVAGTIILADRKGVPMDGFAYEYWTGQDFVDNSESSMVTREVSMASKEYTGWTGQDLALTLGNCGQSMNKYADVGIKPVGTLKETADLLGEVLSGLDFQEDTDGTFDEYPCFIAYDDEYMYALLGNPSPEDDVREDPDGNFQLKVQSIDDSSDDHLDVSGELVSLISRDGRLSSYELE